MAKKDLIIMEGEVVQALPNAMFKVELSNGIIVLCTINGKMRQNNIRVMEGDKVKIEMSPYDLTRGRISTRL